MQRRSPDQADRLSDARRRTRKASGEPELAPAGLRTAEPRRYRNVYAVLCEEIASGTHAVGAKLPTEEELSRRFAVSRQTVRVALRELKQEGLIHTQQGAGSRVLRQTRPVQYTSSVSSLEELLQYATEIRYEVDKSGMVTADAEIAARVGCPVGQRWLRLQGVRTRAPLGEIVAWTEVFVHADYAGVGLMVGTKPGSIFSFIEAMYGVEFQEVEQLMRIGPMAPHVCADLGCEPETTGVDIRRSYKLGSGQLIEVAFTIHPADRFSYAITLNRKR